MNIDSQWKRGLQIQVDVPLLFFVTFWSVTCPALLVIFVGPPLVEIIIGWNFLFLCTICLTVSQWKPNSLEMFFITFSRLVIMNNFLSELRRSPLWWRHGTVPQICVVRNRLWLKHLTPTPALNETDNYRSSYTSYIFLRYLMTDSFAKLINKHICLYYWFNHAMFAWMIFL